MIKTKAGPVHGERLRSFVERIEKLDEEKAAIGSDIRDVLSEAQSVGYDKKTIRWAINERKLDAADRDERDALRDVYAHALGMAVDLVRVEGLSQREAAKRAGVSKSSVNRALAVPEVSQPATPVPDEGIGHNSKRACILPAPGTWKEITSSRDAAEVEWAAAADRIEAEAYEEFKAAENGCGEGSGIRTHETPERLAGYEPTAIIHSATPERSADVSTRQYGTPPQPEPCSTTPKKPELGAVAEPQAPRVASNDYDAGPIPKFLDRSVRV